MLTRNQIRQLAKASQRREVVSVENESPMTFPKPKVTYKSRKWYQRRDFSRKSGQTDQAPGDGQHPFEGMETEPTEISTDRPIEELMEVSFGNAMQGDNVIQVDDAYSFLNRLPEKFTNKPMARRMLFDDVDVEIGRREPREVASLDVVGHSRHELMMDSSDSEKSLESVKESAGEAHEELEVSESNEEISESEETSNPSISIPQSPPTSFLSSTTTSSSTNVSSTNHSNSSVNQSFSNHVTSSSESMTNQSTTNQSTTNQSTTNSSSTDAESTPQFIQNAVKEAIQSILSTFIPIYYTVPPRGTQTQIPHPFPMFPQMIPQMQPQMFPQMLPNQTVTTCIPNQSENSIMPSYQDFQFDKPLPPSPPKTLPKSWKYQPLNPDTDPLIEAAPSFAQINSFDQTLNRDRPPHVQETIYFRKM